MSLADVVFHPITLGVLGLVALAMVGLAVGKWDQPNRSKSNVRNSN